MNNSEADNLNDNLISIIKKKKPVYKKQVNVNYKLKPKIKAKTKQKHFSFDNIVEMINQDYIKKFQPKLKHLDKIVEEPELKIDYHLSLSHFVHSVSNCSNSFNMSWPFGDNCILTFIRNHNKFIKDKWYYKTKNVVSIIKNPQQFINDHINDLEVFLENNKIINNIITQLQPILGEYYLTSAEIGWGLSIGNNIFLKIVIDRFNFNNIQVTFDNKTNTHNNTSLIKFINENLDKITIFKQEIVKYNLNKKAESEEKRKQDLVQLKIEKDLENLQLEEKIKEYDSTIKQKKNCSLFINLSKKQLIEQITCKPYTELN